MSDNPTDSAITSDVNAWLYASLSDLTCSDSPPKSDRIEDFGFSFCLDLDSSSSAPLLDMALAQHTSPWSVITGSNTPQSSFSCLPPLSSPGLSQLPETTAGCDVPEKDEQQAFPSFLDSLLADQDKVSSANHLDLPSQLPQSPSAMQLEQFADMFDPMHLNTAEEERQHMILQSLDQSKRLQQHIKLLASMPTTTKANPAPQLAGNKRNSLPGRRASVRQPTPHKENTPSSKESVQSDKSPPRSSKSPSEVRERTTSPYNRLTEQEKRAYNIASEQKRRSIIRKGFTDLANLTPTLKSVNNSKSTILFKAVDYIKYLEKRNKRLRDILYSLEMRAKLSVCAGNRAYLHNTVQRPALPNATAANECTDDSPSSTTLTAILAHKLQQKQLLHLQEQLQFHQQLLARKGI